MFPSLAIADGSWYEVSSLLIILAGVMHPLTTNIFECVNLKIQMRLKLSFSAIFKIFCSPLKWRKSQMYVTWRFCVRYVTRLKKKRRFSADDNMFCRNVKITQNAPNYLEFLKKNPIHHILEKSILEYPIFPKVQFCKICYVTHLLIKKKLI